MTIPSPLSAFRPITVRRWPAGASLHRNHARIFRPAEFNPGVGQSTRFAHFDAVTSGARVPSLYATTDRESAAFETIFHDVMPTTTLKSVRRHDVEARAVSEIAPNRDLTLASLFTPDLMAWGLTRADLIDTQTSEYPSTMPWARAIHAADPMLDGLIWTSRLCDPERCLMLFGDRVTEAEFRVIATADIADDPAVFREMCTFGRRAGITILT